MEVGLAACIEDFLRRRDPTVRRWGVRGEEGGAVNVNGKSPEEDDGIAFETALIIGDDSLSLALYISICC